MYCNEKMKLNRYVSVKIPKNSEYFRRFNGNLPVPSNGSFTGDEVVPQGMTKTEQLSYAARKNSEYLESEAQEVHEDNDKE